MWIGHEGVSNEGVLVVADREEGNIKNYAGPKILLESLSFHGDFAPGGGIGGWMGEGFPCVWWHQVVFWLGG